MPEDVRKYTATKIQPRPFRVVAFDCRCSCRHFNSGECIICILAVRPLRASTMSPGSNGHRRISQQSDRCGQRALCRALFSPFSRVVARYIRIKWERIREEIPKTDGERSKSCFPCYETLSPYGVSLFAWEGNNVPRTILVRAKALTCNSLLSRDTTYNKTETFSRRFKNTCSTIPREYESYNNIKRVLKILLFFFLLWLFENSNCSS